MPTLIHVAEDDHLLANLLVQVLRDAFDCECRVYDDGLDFYAAVYEKKPSLLILDVLLPTVNGLAIAHLLKFQEDFQEIPILMMSSMPEHELRAAAEAVHADRFLAKPFDIGIFLETVAELLPQPAMAKS